MRLKLKDELEQKEQGGNNNASEYESLIQKLEADIRGHIRVDEFNIFPLGF